MTRAPSAACCLLPAACCLPPAAMRHRGMSLQAGRAAAAAGGEGQESNSQSPDTRTHLPRPTLNTSRSSSFRIRQANAWVTQMYAAGCCQNLAEYAGFARVMQKRGTMTVLTRLLESPEPRVARFAEGALRNAEGSAPPPPPPPPSSLRGSPRFRTRAPPFPKRAPCVCRIDASPYVTIVGYRLPSLRESAGGSDAGPPQE